VSPIWSPGKNLALSRDVPLIHGIALPRPTHATLAVSTGRFFGMPVPAVWEILGETISDLQQTSSFHTHAAVLMSNHIHLLLTFPAGGAQPALKALAFRFTSRVRRESGPPGLRFGLYPHSYEIRHPGYFCRALKYVYRNPVRAGICGRVEEYPFSTIHGLLGTERLRFPLHETYFGQSLAAMNPEELLLWLNTP
jgi:putative transposase